MNILLVVPDFPFARKSKNHHEFIPIGLLKLASYYRSEVSGIDQIKLVRGEVNNIDFTPDLILVTSLFTYWSEYVAKSTHYYRGVFPNSEIIVGGIYASLMPDHCKQNTNCDEVFTGLHPEAEKFPPEYDLMFEENDPPMQIIHASRGCFRRCAFCGTWKIEKKPSDKKSILSEIRSNKLIFYDNNFLQNSNIESILDELKEATWKNRKITCESQSGFDGRLITTHLARSLKEARFINPRIAWDGEYSEHKDIENQIRILTEAGYKNEDIYVFMIYNWSQTFTDTEKKRQKCWELKVQIADCRYRPLNQTFDYYNAKLKQTNDDYYIHPNWTDGEIKQFRKNVRRQNICVRHGFSYYSRDLEHKLINNHIKQLTEDAWYPDEVTSLIDIR